MALGMAHLDLQNLTGPNVEVVLDDLRIWLLDKKFVKQGGNTNVERCVAEGLEDALKPLVSILNFVKSSRPGYTVLRLTGPKSAKIHNSTGPAYLIPIEVREGSPMVSTRQATLGEAIYITEQVDVSPKLDFVIIVP